MIAPRNDEARRQPGSIKTTFHFDHINKAFPKRSILPPYAKQLTEALACGYSVGQLVIALGWDYGKVFARIVITHDMDPYELDLSCASDQDCLICHDDEYQRAFDVARVTLQQFGAKRATIFDLSHTTKTIFTDDLRELFAMECGR